MVSDFWKLLGTNSTERALNKQWFDVGSCPADPGSFLLSCTLIKYMGVEELNWELLIRLVDKIIVEYKTTVDGEERRKSPLFTTLSGK